MVPCHDSHDGPRTDAVSGPTAHQRIGLLVELDVGQGPDLVDECNCGYPGGGAEGTSDETSSGYLAVDLIGVDLIGVGKPWLEPHRPCDVGTRAPVAIRRGRRPE